MTNSNTKSEITIEDWVEIPDFKLGEVVYKAGYDRSYHGLYIDQVRVDNFLLNFIQGKTKLVWEFGNITYHKQEIFKNNIMFHKKSECVYTISEARNHIEKIILHVVKELEQDKDINLQSIQDLRTLLKQESKEVIEKNKGINKLVNSLKRIDLDNQLTKKLENY